MIPTQKDPPASADQVRALDATEDDLIGKARPLTTTSRWPRKPTLTSPTTRTTLPTNRCSMTTTNRPTHNNLSKWPTDVKHGGLGWRSD